MSLLRKGIVLVGIIMLLPADQRKQTDFAGITGAAVDRTLSFCDRNPASCAAGRELWDTFVRKAEFGLELASNVARDYMARDQESVRQASQQAPQSPARTAPPADSGVRLEPYGQRGTLTRADLAPQWRGTVRVTP